MKEMGSGAGLFPIELAVSELDWVDTCMPAHCNALPVRIS